MVPHQTHGNLLQKANKWSTLIGQLATVHICDWLTIFEHGMILRVKGLNYVMGEEGVEPSCTLPLPQLGLKN